MKNIFAALIPLVLIIGCAGDALVEFGVNDDALIDAPLGDIVMRVLSIDISENGSYTTVWNSGTQVTVPLQTGGYESITDLPVTVIPGTYDHVRVTIDSVRFVSDSTVTLIDTQYVFDANAFTNIIISENDDLSLVILINSVTWFDAGSGQVTGVPFDQATLRVYYD